MVLSPAAAGLKSESAPKGKAFGDLLQDAPASVSRGSSISVSFVGGSLRNLPSEFETFLSVERRVEGAAGTTWEVVATDSDPETRLMASREASHVRVTIQWDVPSDATPGDYRISHSGAWLKWHLLSKDTPTKYSGVSATFAVA